MTSHPYGLFGLLHTETLRDELCNTEAGQRIVYLQDQREMIISDRPVCMAFLIAILFGAVFIGICMICNVPIENDSSTQGKAVACAIVGFIVGFFQSSLTVEKSASIKEIDIEIRQIARKNPKEAEILERVMESCSYSPVKKT